MAELYLATGFLGAGKSTFMKSFIRLFAGRKVQLIINDFGREGVDGTLLEKLDADLAEITGGSVFCSCRIDQFEKALRTSVGENVDVVLVEASGLADPTGVRKLLGQTDRFPDITFKGAVCLIDAVRFPKEYAKARTVSKQLASSDVAVVNKIDCATSEQLGATLALIEGQRPDIPVVETTYGKVDATLLDTIAHAQHEDASEATLTADLTSRELYLTIADGIDVEHLKRILSLIIEETYRIKGFVRTDEGITLVDCASNVPEVRPFSDPVPEDRIGTLVVLSGQGMHARAYAKKAREWYPDLVVGIA